MSRYKLDTERKALVIFSGGMDSTICLFWAIKEFGRSNVSAVTFDYGQRHSAEIESARKIAELAEISWQLVSIPDILRSSSPLVSKSKLEQHSELEDFSEGLQPTFVPARNMLFFTIAANIAYEQGIMNIISGVCEADYGGYYDCRQSFVRSMQETINLALLGHYGERVDAERIILHSPLMRLNKREELQFARSGFRTVTHIQERKLFASRNLNSHCEEGEAIQGLQHNGSPRRSAARDDKFDLSDECFDALAYSHTCYAGAQPPCGSCHACHLRARAFEEAGFKDPLIERSRFLATR